MTEQARAAAEVMEEWLTHPDELGKKPAKLEIAGEFNLHGLHYYIFKFKKSALSSWKVAVCGGYEGDGLGHCGHIYSRMETYDPATAQEKCVEMVENIRQYWKDRAEEEENETGEEEHPGGDFVGFVLLSSPEFDPEHFRSALKEDWGIQCPRDTKDTEDEETALAFYENGMMVTIGFMDIPVPDGEAEYWANSNFMTREKSLEIAKNHKAHLIVAVMGQDSTPVETGMLFVKIVSACLKAPNALGVYDCGTVWLKEIFIQSAMVMKEGKLPLMDFFFIGLYQDDKGVSSWSNGLRSFGREELEIIASRHSPSEVYDMMFSICAYVIQEGAVLRDGETLGFTKRQKLPITLSKGIAVEGQSLKIKY